MTKCLCIGCQIVCAEFTSVAGRCQICINFPVTWYMRSSSELISCTETNHSAFIALLLGSFRLLSDFPSDIIAAHQASSRLGPVHNIRNLLTSSDPNQQYLFLTCLQCLDPGLWSGTHPARPAVLEGWEVERVMKFLDSADSFIRKKVGSVLIQSSSVLTD